LVLALGLLGDGLSAILHRLEQKEAQEKDFAYRINRENAFQPHD
jgi:hypothetical protein